MWSWSSRDVIYQGNEIAFIRDGGRGDRTAFDYDSHCSGYQIHQYNYTHHNSGGQMLHMNGLSSSDIENYIPNTKINRFNISAYEPFETWCSANTKLSFVYNNVYYRSVLSTTIKKC